ncbi:MAG TPA: DUF3040 domain-containing protein [Acidimicrobiales bacterium]|nr:DUF3040 domain-containing protein [Acidimicrobiales bacterium]
MLDHDEERRLAEIEEHLLLDHPDLAQLFDDVPEQVDARSRPGPLTAVVRTFVALAMAIALTTIVTVALGPDLGGLAAVVAFCAVGMYGYQSIRGCPGLRRARGQDRP